jgi:hypothetical protein
MLALVYPKFDRQNNILTKKLIEYQFAVYTSSQNNIGDHQFAKYYSLRKLTEKLE